MTDRTPSVECEQFTDKTAFQISGAKAQHKAYRVITMIRGTLVNLVYQRTLELSTSSLDESKAVTLMSADVERIGTGLRTMHEVWASIIEIALALWLIQGQLGISTVSAALVTLRTSSSSSAHILNGFKIKSDRSIQFALVERSW